MNTPATFQIHVEGMMCQKNCATTVQKALESLEVVLHAKVEFQAKLAEVWISPQKLNNSTEMILLNAIEDVGFEAKCISRPELIPHYRFQVEGMMCQKSCANTVQNALKEIKGIKVAQVTFATKYADIWLQNYKYFNDSMKNELLETIEAVGFEASLISSSEPSPSTASDNDNNDNIYASSSPSHENSFNDDKDQPDLILNVKGMIHATDCPDKIKSLLCNIDGVMSVDVNYNKSLVNIYGFADSEKIIDQLIKNGYLASPPQQQQKSHMNKKSVTIKGRGGKIHDNDDDYTTFNNEYEYNDYLELKVIGMSCANCSKGIEKAISVLTGIHSIKIALLAQKAEIIHNVNIISVETIIDHIVELGYEAFFILSKNRKEPNKREYTFVVAGMSCTQCTTKIEDAVYNTFGRILVEDAKCTLMNNRLVVKIMNPISEANSTKHLNNITAVDSSTVGPRDILDLVLSLGYGCKYMTKADLKKDSKENDDDVMCTPAVFNPCSQVSLSELQLWVRLLVFAAIFGVPVVFMHLFVPHIPDAAMYLSQKNTAVCHGALTIGQTVMMCLNIPIQIGVGYKFYRSAYLGALHFNFGMDFLIVLGTSITFLYSSFSVMYGCSHTSVESIKHLFFDVSGMLYLFVTLGKFFEAYAKGKTVSAISTLLQLQPLQATLVEETNNFEGFKNHKKNLKHSNTPTITGHDLAISKAHTHTTEVLRNIEIGLVQRGDVLKLLPGCRVPTDGIILSGSSSIDESMITGESVPVSKSVGDFVFGSTINLTNVMYMEVTAISEENALSQIISLVESAQTNKAPIQAYADRMASLFTPFVLTIASITFLGMFFIYIILVYKMTSILKYSFLFLLIFYYYYICSLVYLLQDIRRSIYLVF